MTSLTVTGLAFNFSVMFAQNISMMQYDVSVYVDDTVSSDETDEMLLE